MLAAMLEVHYRSCWWEIGASGRAICCLCGDIFAPPCVVEAIGFSRESHARWAKVVDSHADAHVDQLGRERFAAALSIFSMRMPTSIPVVREDLLREVIAEVWSQSPTPIEIAGVFGLPVPPTPNRSDPPNVQQSYSGSDQQLPPGIPVARHRGP